MHDMLYFIYVYTDEDKRVPNQLLVYWTAWIDVEKYISARVYVYIGMPCICGLLHIYCLM